MCGIVGYIANRKHGFNNNEVKAVKELLYINALRGIDSTGVFYVNNKGDTQTHKEVGESAKFLKSTEWESSEKELFRCGQAVVAHCRAATKGARTDANAHPFIVDNKIVLVHNGTYMGSHDHIAKTEVDSHAIAHAISEAGDDIAAGLRKVNAAYALVWYNTETSTLYAVRNKHRPLWFAQMEDGSMMFASEVGFLYTAAWRNDMKIQKNYPVMLPEDQLFSCDLADITKPYAWTDIDCEYVPPAKKEEPKKVESKSPQTALSLVPKTSKTTENVQRHYNGVPSLTEVAAQLKLGRVLNNLNFAGEAGRGSILFVEATDYQAVDETAGVYYVFGKIISSRPNLNGMIAGWEITADNELEVLEYTSGRFYDCTVEYSIGRGPATPGSEITLVWKMSQAVESTKVSVDIMELNA